MKILLTGKNGQVGHALVPRLSALGTLCAVGTAECDFQDETALRTLVRRERPDVIVNPAAYTAVDRAESEPAMAHAINARAPEILAQEAHTLGALLIHFSTDYVFDGTKTTAYTEDDVPNPQSVYGASKWAGEQAVQAHCARHLILRTAWVFSAHGQNFAKTMLRLGAERDHLSVVADQFGTPTPAELLADVVAKVITQWDTARWSDASNAAFPFGVYHATATGVTHWQAYAKQVISQARTHGAAMRVQADAIHAIDTAAYPTPARRPANSQLDTHKLESTFAITLPHWEAGVNDVVKQLNTSEYIP